jgi:hypothetical protein
MGFFWVTCGAASKNKQKRGRGGVLVSVAELSFCTETALVRNHPIRWKQRKHRRNQKNRVIYGRSARLAVRGRKWVVKKRNEEETGESFSAFVLSEWDFACSLFCDAWWPFDY